MGAALYFRGLKLLLPLRCYSCARVVCSPRTRTGSEWALPLLCTTLHNQLDLSPQNAILRHSASSSFFKAGCIYNSRVSFASFTFIPNVSAQPKPSQEFKEPILPQPGEQTDVVVTHVVSPHEIYVQKVLVYSFINLYRAELD